LNSIVSASPVTISRFRRNPLTTAWEIPSTGTSTKIVEVAPEEHQPAVGERDQTELRGAPALREMGEILITLQDLR